MTSTQFVTALTALGPVVLVAGFVAGYRYHRVRDLLGRTHHHDHR